MVVHLDQERKKLPIPAVDKAIFNLYVLSFQTNSRSPLFLLKISNLGNGYRFRKLANVPWYLFAKKELHNDIINDDSIAGFQCHANQNIKNIRQIKSRIWEMKGGKYTKTLVKIWVEGIIRIRDIRFTQIYRASCMETPCWSKVPFRKLPFCKVDKALLRFICFFFFRKF